MNTSKGFLFFYDWEKAFSNLDGEDFKELFLSMLKFQRDGTPPPKFTGAAEIISDFVFPQLERRIESSKCGKEGAKKRYQNKETNIFPDNIPNAPLNGGTISTRQDKDKTRQKQDIDKDVPPISPKGDDTELEKRFCDFWNIYPKKIGKEAARKAYKKLKPNVSLSQKLIEAVEAQKKCSQWSDTKYIPNASTWLNGRRWEDEIQETGHTKIDTLPTNISILEKYYKSEV